jgi:Stress responsive A/B Barrel Domain
MIRHCVFVRFAPDVTDEERSRLFDDIAALGARLPGFLAAHVGGNVSPELGMDKGYSAGFILDFADAAARDGYLDDDEHRQIGTRIVAAAVGGTDGVFVYDLETS